MKHDKKRFKTSTGFFFVLTLAAHLQTGGQELRAGSDIVEASNRLLFLVRNEGADAATELAEALHDTRPLLRFRAAHLVAFSGATATPELVTTALKNPDVEVRYIVIRGLADLDLLDGYWSVILTDEAPKIQRYVRLTLLSEHSLHEADQADRFTTVLAQVYADAEAEQRQQAVRMIAAFDMLTPQSKHVLITATDDADAGVRQAAYEGILEHITTDWPEAAALLAKAAADAAGAINTIGHDMRWKLLEVHQLRMPRDGWRFATDSETIGRENGWFAPDFDDGGWRTDVPIETCWQQHIGDAPYHGKAWYRRTVDVPELPEWDRAYLHFEGVDEQAWVWMNGQPVGAHELGQVGWDIPFVLEITDMIKPGAVNHIAVLAENTSGAGGIWRPVRLRVINTGMLANEKQAPDQ